MDAELPDTTTGNTINYRAFIEALNHVVFTLDDKGRFTYLSPGCYDILGLKPEELYGKPITSVVIPDGRNRICKKYQSVLHGASYPSDYQVVDTHGGIHHVRAVSRAFINDKGMPGVIGAISEIRNWENLEETLQRAEDKFSQFVKCSRDGILFMDEYGTLVVWSPAMEQILGLQGSVAIGKKYWDVQYSLLPDVKKTPDAREHLKKYILSFLQDGHLSGQENHVEQEIWRPDHSVRVIDSFMFTIPGENGFMAGAILRDATDRKKSEDALKQANHKLTLLSGITRHDINNQLTVLQGYLQILERNPADPSHTKYLQKAKTAAQQISAMIQFTREYEKIGVNSPVWQSCRSVVDDAAREIHFGQIELKNKIPADKEVFADPLIVKVFYNLIDNAVRYGGKITTLQFSFEESNRNHIILCKDDGDGIPAEEKERIFERGYGKNTGLGLALTREILEITGITIRETGEPGRGARFEIIVPEGSFRSAGK